jgi:D-alanine-D-alanine ligase
MKTRNFLTVLFLVATLFKQEVYAQVSIDADQRIEQQIARKASKQMAGYRLQICFDSDKSIIDEARNRFISMYPKMWNASGIGYSELITRLVDLAFLRAKHA